MGATIWFFYFSNKTDQLIDHGKIENKCPLCGGKIDSKNNNCSICGVSLNIKCLSCGVEVCLNYEEYVEKKFDCPECGKLNTL